MFRLTRIELALRALTALFLLIAAGALLARPSVRAGTAPPVDGAPVIAPPATTTLDPALTTTIIDANVFSAARKPPATRYDPLAIDEPAAAYVPPAPVAADAAAESDDGVPRLYGIVAGPNGAAALLRLDASVPAAQLLREGESSGRYRVVKINEQSVVLTGPAGRVELRLKRPEG